MHAEKSVYQKKRVKLNSQQPYIGFLRQEMNFNFSICQKLKKYNVTGSYIFLAKFKTLILQVNMKTKIYV